MGLADVIRSNAGTDLAQDEHEARSTLPSRKMNQGSLPNRWAIGVARSKADINPRDPYGSWQLTYGPVADDTKIMSVAGAEGQCILYNLGDGAPIEVKFHWDMPTQSWQDSWQADHHQADSQDEDVVALAVPTVNDDIEDDEAAPALADSFSFSVALDALKRGSKVARRGWNGKGMFLFLVNGSRFTVNRAPLLGIYPEGTVINYRSHLDMRTADGEIVPWVASQSDLLEDDWCLVG